MVPCTQCRADVADGARFCPHCGASQLVSVREHREAVRTERTRFGGAVLAFQWVFVAPLLGTVGLAFWYASGDLSDELLFVLHGLLLVGAGCAGAYSLRPRGWAACVPWRTATQGYFLALIGAAAMLAIGWTWVALLDALIEVDGDQAELTTTMLISILVVAPVVEEWLCRGVLWEACRRITSVRGTIAITAILFGFLHGLNGGWLLEIPHRALGGVVLGILRYRTGSLIPCVLAHFLNNLVAVLLM